MGGGNRKRGGGFMKGWEREEGVGDRAWVVRMGSWAGG